MEVCRQRNARSGKRAKLEPREGSSCAKGAAEQTVLSGKPRRLDGSNEATMTSLKHIIYYHYSSSSLYFNSAAHSVDGARCLQCGPLALDWLARPPLEGISPVGLHLQRPRSRSRSKSRSRFKSKASQPASRPDLANPTAVNPRAAKQARRPIKGGQPISLRAPPRLRRGRAAESAPRTDYRLAR